MSDEPDVTWATIGRENERVAAANAADRGRHAIKEARDLRATISRLTADNERLRAIMRRVEPHLDAIICYASSMNEHEPNRIAHDFRAALEPPK